MRKKTQNKLINEITEELRGYVETLELYTEFIKELLKQRKMYQIVILILSIIIIATLLYCKKIGG